MNKQNVGLYMSGLALLCIIALFIYGENNRPVYTSPIPDPITDKVVEPPPVTKFRVHFAPTWLGHQTWETEEIHVAQDGVGMPFMFFVDSNKRPINLYYSSNVWIEKIQ